jgi:hypothetical protein
MSTGNGKRVGSWMKFGGLVVLIAPIAFAAGWCIWNRGDRNDFYTRFIFTNYVTFFLLPYAAFFALYLVSIFESANGPIEFELLGLKFKGASGPIIFWVLIFLSAVLALKLLWRTEA